MAAELDIYVESLRRFHSTSGYAIQTLLPHLLDAGIRVRVLENPVQSGGGAAAFLHIDLTDVPEIYHGIHKHYDRTINGAALSIHRYLYSTLRLGAGDVHKGPVVVKTVLNSRGRPEFIWRRYRSRWASMTHVLRKVFTPGFKERMCPHYRVYDSIGEVPNKVWRNKRLMVEKFAFDSLDLPIVKHRYMFLLEAELNMRQVYDDVLCASGKILSNEVGGLVPDEVKAVRRRLNLEFGAIDYFVVDGKAVVVDANKTVGSSAIWMKRNRFRQEFNDRMAATLVDFIRR